MAAQAASPAPQRPSASAPAAPSSAAAGPAPAAANPPPAAPAPAPQPLDRQVPLNDFWYLAQQGKADLEASRGTYSHYAGPFVATLGGTATGVVGGLCVASNFGMLGGAAIGFPLAALACVGALVLGIGLAQATRKAMMLYTLQQQPRAQAKMESLREMHTAFAALPQPQAWETQTQQTLEQSMAAFSLTKAGLLQDCRWAAGSALLCIPVCALTVVLAAAFSGQAKGHQAAGGNCGRGGSGPVYYIGPTWHDRPYGGYGRGYGAVGQTPPVAAVVTPPLHLVSRVRMRPHWVTALC